jgi:hypothetical protein
MNYLSPTERWDTLCQINCQKSNTLVIPHVPIIIPDYQVDVSRGIDDLLELADGPGFNSKMREGLVFKANEPDEVGNIFSFKVINNKYIAV